MGTAAPWGHRPPSIMLAAILAVAAAASSLPGSLSVISHAAGGNSTLCDRGWALVARAVRAAAAAKLPGRLAGSSVCASGREAAEEMAKGVLARASIAA